jgi:hypothetical protein
MQPLEKNGYTRQEVIDALHGKYAPRNIRFRYDLLDKNDNRIKTLDSVESGEVSMASLASIKRTARFIIKDKGDINWLSDRIQPFVELKVPEISKWHDTVFKKMDTSKADFENGILTDTIATGAGDVELDKWVQDWSTITVGSSPSWISSLGSWLVREYAGSNALRSDANSNAPGYAIYPEVFAGKKTVKLSIVDVSPDGSNSPHPGFIIHWIDSANYDAIYLRLGSTTKELVWWKVRAGTSGATVIASLSGVGEDQWIDLEITSDDLGGLTALINGIQVYSVTTGWLTGSKYIGFWSHGSGEAYYENVVVMTHKQNVGEAKSIPLDLSPVGTKYTSKVDYNVTEPTGTKVLLETSVDGGEWQGQPNGVEIATDTSLEFDGVDDYVSFPNGELDVTTDGEIEIHFNCSKRTGAHQMLIDRYPGAYGYSIFIEGTSNKICVRYGTIAFGNIGPEITLNQDHKITMSKTYNGNLKVILDGVIIYEGSSGTHNATITGSSFVGSRTGSTFYFAGSISFLSIKDKNVTLNRLFFNEGAGTVAYDRTSNANDGTINGATWKRTLLTGDLKNRNLRYRAFLRTTDTTKTPQLHEVSISLTGKRFYRKEEKWIDFPLGIFLLSSPTRADRNGHIYRDVEAFDGLVILRDDKFESRYTVRAGTNYRTAVIDILASAGITKHNIEQTDKTLPTDIEFEPGKEKLYAINQLLRAINYNQIYVDVYGYFTSSTYRSPSIRAAEYTYADDKLSITYPGMTEEMDLFNVPNKWVVVLSNPEREPLVSTYINENPNSPTSTVNRGRTIVDHREIDNIADQQSLDSYVQRIAFEASQVYGKVEFETAIVPAHDFADVLQIEYSSLGISGKYAETGWTIPLTAGGKMKHSLRKVVSI